MVKKFTVSELSRLLGVSVNTTWKKIDKKGLTTTKEVVNNREITVVILDDTQFNELISDSPGISGVHNTVNNVNYEDSLHVNNINDQYEEDQTQVMQGADMVAVIDSVMNYSREMNDQVKEYVDRVINAEKQVQLLENLESRKDNECITLSAKAKELESSLTKVQSENELLKNENEELKLKLQEVQQKLEKEKNRPFWQRNIV